MKEKLTILFKLMKPLIKVFLFVILLILVIEIGYNFAVLSYNKEGILRTVLKIGFAITYFAFAKIYKKIEM